MRRSSIALALSAALLAAFASPGHAAPFDYRDLKGDALLPEPGLDLLHVEYRTTGTGSGRRYVPRNLVLTVTAAGPIVRMPGVTYVMIAQTSTCGELKLQYSDGTAKALATGQPATVFAECGVDATSSVLDAAAKVSGSKLELTLPLSTVPPELVAGTKLTEFQGSTEVRDPVVAGLPWAEFTDFPLGMPLAVDIAYSNGTWTLG